jgi:hypothetical protein
MKLKGLHPPNLELMPEGHAWLLCEFGGKDKQEAYAKAHKCMEALANQNHAQSMKLFDDPAREPAGVLAGTALAAAGGIWLARHYRHRA